MDLSNMTTKSKHYSESCPSEVKEKEILKELASKARYNPILQQKRSV